MPGLDTATLDAAKRLGHRPTAEEERQALRATLRQLYPLPPPACGAAVNLECDCTACQGAPDTTLPHAE